MCPIGARKRVKVNKLGQRCRFMQLRTLCRRGVILLRAKVLELLDTAIIYMLDKVRKGAKRKE